MPISGYFVVLRLKEGSQTHLLARCISHAFGSVSHTKDVCEFQCPPDIAKVQEFLGGIKKDHPSIDISFQRQSALAG